MTETTAPSTLKLVFHDTFNDRRVKFGGFGSTGTGELKAA